MSGSGCSRRELLVAFLGASVAACVKPRRGDDVVPGRFIDGAFQLGHRLRGAPLPRATQIQRIDALVVGGGVAGLSAAWRLSSAGVNDLVVCELEDGLGGTSRSGENAVSAFPLGAHYLPAPLTASGPVPRLLSELGVLTGVDDAGRPTYAEQVLVREPEERLFYRGFWYEGLYLQAGASADDKAQLLRFESAMNAFAAARDGRGRRAFAVPTLDCSDDAEWTRLDRLSMAAWLDSERFTSPRLRWWVDYACKDEFGTTAEYVSAWAGIWYFAARREGDGRRSAGHLSWPEGNGHWVRALAERVGTARVRKGLLVHTVEPHPEGVRAFGIDAATGHPLAFDARQVVLAAPRHVAKHVVAPWRGRPPAFHDAFDSGPWVVANLTVKRPPSGRGFPLAWDNVFYESKSLGYVAATHQRPRASEHGPTVLTWYYPLTGRDTKAERTRLLANTYEEWAHIVLSDFAVPHPQLREDAVELEVMRWGHGMVRPSPGFLWGGAREEAGQSLGALHFAHSDLGGMALFEEAMAYGVRAGERALRGLGRAFSSWS